MLTERQSQYLAFIQSYAAQYGRVPTPYKIAHAMSVDHSTAHRAIDALVAAGALEKISGSAAHYSLPNDFALPHGLQVALLAASERAALKPKLLLAQIVREWCERIG
jgi:DNA-binding IclR family transcriptional regulator